MEPILQIEHLSITFTQYSRGARRRELPVIRDLSLSLSPGEVTAVVGASGSGKSLLAHAILGLLPYNRRGASSTRARSSHPAAWKSSGAGRLPWCPRASPTWTL